MKYQLVDVDNPENNLKNLKHKTMKTTKKMIVASIAAFALTATSISVFAYQGDPAVQGPNYTPERHAEMTQAFETNDYNAWAKLVEQNNGRIAEMINEGNFAQFAQAHDLALKGDLDGARAIRAELGLGLRNGSRTSGGQDMHEGQGQFFRDGSQAESGMKRGGQRGMGMNR